MPHEVGRVAMRREGACWNAYYARPHTMRGAILLGAIRLDLIEACPVLRREFLDLMTNAAEDYTRVHLGFEVEWGEQRLSQVEPAGHG